MIIPQVPGIWTVGGPAGSGKTTLIKSLMETVYRARALRRIVTRAKRPTDDPQEYIHMSLEEFNRRDQAGEFFQPVEIHGNMNGVFKTDLEAAFKADHVVIADLNAQNTEKLYQYGLSHHGPLLDKFKSVFLHIADESELRRRLAERGEKDIECRIADCRSWFDYARKSFLKFQFLDATKPKTVVYKEAIDYFTSP